jgi:hypothetical protein
MLVSILMNIILYIRSLARKFFHESLKLDTDNKDIDAKIHNVLSCLLVLSHILEFHVLFIYFVIHTSLELLIFYCSLPLT